MTLLSGTHWPLFSFFCRCSCICLDAKLPHYVCQMKFSLHLFTRRRFVFTKEIALTPNKINSTLKKEQSVYVTFKMKTKRIDSGETFGLRRNHLSKVMTRSKALCKSFLLVLKVLIESQCYEWLGNSTCGKRLL